MAGFTLAFRVVLGVWQFMLPPVAATLSAPPVFVMVADAVDEQPPDAVTVTV